MPESIHPGPDPNPERAPNLDEVAAVWDPEYRLASKHTPSDERLLVRIVGGVSNVIIAIAKRSRNPRLTKDPNKLHDDLPPEERHFT